MRAKDFAGKIRDFTPTQVMKRVAGKSGPKLPGAGLAQWTSAPRRAGLFKHQFNGKVLGADILLDMDAQLDYLNVELTQKYAALHATLVAGNVTLNAACDALVLKFEVPGAVLDSHGHLLPVSNPSVQKVLNLRRARARDALNAFTAQP
jgi:hypothetical protein